MMILTYRELEVMDELWARDVPMSITEIVNVSGNRTWSENSIYKMIARLERKGLIRVCPSETNYAKKYVPLITFREYAAKLVAGTNKNRKHNVRISVDEFIDAVKAIEDEWEDE